MSFGILAFQVLNLNDYDVKLFANFEEKQLYITRFNILEKYSDEVDKDEGSSQRLDKLNLSSETPNDNILKSFPFTALFKKELTLLKVESTFLTQYIALYNEEYNYILILYPDSIETVSKLTKYIQQQGIPVEVTKSFNYYISQKIDQLDEKIFKQTQGRERLQRKINPKLTKEVVLLQNSVKIITEDSNYEDVYLKLIGEFDQEFIHSQNDKFEFHSSTTQKNI